MKAKRVHKQKTKTTQQTPSTIRSREEELHAEDEHPRPTKRPRLAKRSDQAPTPTNSASATPKPPGQIISSLFSHNPKVDVQNSSDGPKKPLEPSNAPLATAGGFANLGLHPYLVAHLEHKMGVTRPTSIQRATLPIFIGSSSSDMSGRDVFIQSQTGSGKTLSFLLPIIHDLLPLSMDSYIDRSIGTLAIIIAPTRELAKQISDVLEAVLNLKLRPDNDSEDVEAPRYARWLVSGLLSGGATKTHEKARLRKGIPFLVSTPGRLLDHLQNTSSFNVGKCRWLVLDEADRLMELGFEETIKGIIRGLDGRSRLAMQAMKEGNNLEVGGWDWGRRRRTVLCSATIREDVQKLAGVTLTNPVVIKALDNKSEDTPSHTPSAPSAVPSITGFTLPSQLAQNCVVAPLKLRLVALVALLRSILTQHHAKKGCKVIVFLSCMDSVDFHWRLLSGVTMGDERHEDVPDLDSVDGNSNLDGDGQTSDPPDESIAVQSPLLPDTNIFRLHGSLSPPIRRASLRDFSAAPSISSKQSAVSSVLLCTSVASRGLDLPLVQAVIQYDLPTEGGVTEYIHRVGRTARVGKSGDAWSFVAPSEMAWIEWIQKQMQGGVNKSSVDNSKACVALENVSVEDVLARGFGGKGSEYESRATDVQLSFERWVLRRSEVCDSTCMRTCIYSLTFIALGIGTQSFSIPHEGLCDSSL